MRLGAVMAGVVALCAATAGGAGEIYRWTDEHGVVHFADVPPPNVRTETHQMPDRPPPATVAATPPAGTPAAAGTPGARAADKGPARVVITRHDDEPLGDARHGVSGTVENTGGETARDVAIAVHVVSPAQGDDCLREELDVSPSTLKPGEKGTFDAELDHPCFRGETNVTLEPRWE